MSSSDTPVAFEESTFFSNSSGTAGFGSSAVTEPSNFSGEKKLTLLTYMSIYHTCNTTLTNGGEH